MLRRALAVFAAASCVVGLLAPVAEAAGPTVVALPSQLPIGVHTTLFLEGTPYVAGMTATDPAGDVVFDDVVASGEIPVVVATVVAHPSTTTAHDVVLHYPAGSTTTCAGCLTIGPTTARPRVTITPGDGRLDLAFAGGSDYHVWAGSSEYDVTGSTLALTGLTNGIGVRVVAAVHTADGGYGAWFSETDAPGTVPAKPVATASPGRNKVTFSASTATSYGYPVTWTWTVDRPDGLVDHVGASTSPALEYSWNDRRPVTAVAVAHDQFGDSVGSDPITATPYLDPDAVDPVRFSFTRSRGQLTWTVPKSTGGLPVVGYDVLLRVGNGPRVIRRVAGTSFSFAMAPGASAHGNVRAVTELTAGSTAGGQWFGTGSVGLIAALDRSHHAAYKLADEGAWHSLGGPVFASGIAVVRTLTHQALFFASDPAGHLYGRTLHTSWVRLAGGPCFRPSASQNPFPTHLLLACGDGAGHVRYATTYGGTGLPTSLAFTTIGAGGPASVTGESVVFRTASHDAAGHDVLAFNALYGTTLRLPLHCTGDPGAGGGTLVRSGPRTYDDSPLLVACADGRTLRYLTGEYPYLGAGHFSTGAALSTVDLLGTPSVWEGTLTDQPRFGFVAGDHTIREYQAAAGRWRTITGLPVLPDLGAIAWTG